MAVTTNVFSNESKVEHWNKRYFWVQALFYFLQGVFLAGIGTYGSVRLANGPFHSPSRPLSRQSPGFRPF